MSSGSTGSGVCGSEATLPDGTGGSVPVVAARTGRRTLAKALLAVICCTANGATWNSGRDGRNRRAYDSEFQYREEQAEEERHLACARQARCEEEAYYEQLQQEAASTYWEEQRLRYEDITGIENDGVSNA